MADSRRLIQGSQTPYRNSAIDAALGREAHREQGGAPPTRVSANANAATAAGTMVGPREAQNETRVSAGPREAHLETAAERARPNRTVSAIGLQRLGASLQRDENLARKLAKNPRRALAALDFISERDKQVFANIDPQFWNQVAAVSDKFAAAAASKRAMAGVAEAPLSIDGGSGYGSGGGTPFGWAGTGLPPGSGISVGSGVIIHPGSKRGYGATDGDAVPGQSPGAGLPGGGGPPLPGFGAQGWSDGYGSWGGRSAWGYSPNIPVVIGNPSGPATPRDMIPGTFPGEYDRERDVVAHGEAVPSALEDPVTGWDQYWNAFNAGASITGLQAATLAVGAAVGAQPPPVPAPDPNDPETSDTSPQPAPQPSPDGSIPNDSDTGGPRRGGPRSREALATGGMRTGDAMPNLEGTGSPGPIGPSSRGAYLPSGRTAIPTDDSSSSPRRPGPRSYDRSRAASATYRGDAMPDPDADPGHGGPLGPAS